MTKTVIVLPTFNEKDNISAIISVIFKLNILGLFIIVVDDNSPDGTGKIAEQLAEKYPKLTVIHRPGKLGLGSAYITGFRQALIRGADYVFEMDSDFSHDPKEIPKFLKAAEEGYDVIIGSRRVTGGGITGWGYWRHIMSSGAMWFSRLALGLKTKDVTTGYRCYSKKAVESIDWSTVKSNGYSFQEETIYLCEKMELKIKELPIIFKDRTRGVSKLSRGEVLKFFLTILRLRFKK